MGLVDTNLSPGKGIGNTILDMAPLLYARMSDLDVSDTTSMAMFGSSDVVLKWGANYSLDPDIPLTFDSSKGVAGATDAGNILRASGTESDLKLLGDMTIACWYKAAASPPGSSPKFGQYNGSGATEAVNIAYLFFYLAGSAYFRMQWEHGAGNLVTINSDVFNFTAGQWYHIAGVRSNSGADWAVFVDGTQLGSKSTGNTPATGSTSASYNMRQRAGAMLHWAIWDSALSDTDILELYNVGHLGPQAY